MKRTKEKTRSWYKKHSADFWFSKFIRQRDGRCYTCDKHNYLKGLQCGHFVPRQYILTRYDERNNHAQCYACNMLYNGQPSKYANNLIRDYGYKLLEELEVLRQQSKLVDAGKEFDFKKIGDEYKKKYEDLLCEDKL
jgi:hypothetical protein